MNFLIMKRQIKKTSSIALPSYIRQYFIKASVIFLIAFSLTLISLEKTGKVDLKQISLNLVDKIYPIIHLISKPIQSINMIVTETESFYNSYNENKLLKQEMFLAQQKLVDYDRIKGENNNLKELLNYVQKHDLHYISSMIVINSNNSYNKNIVIDAGTNQNVKKGQAVLNQNGLLGRVIKLSDNSSQVMLITDINSRIPIITTTSRQKAIMAGNNDLLPYLMYTNGNSKLINGEIVITSGDGSNIPYGLPIGIVNIDNDEVTIIPITSISDSDFVSIVDNSNTISTNNINNVK